MKKIKERNISGKSSKNHQICLNMIALESLKTSQIRLINFMSLEKTRSKTLTDQQKMTESFKMKLSQTFRED